MDSNLQIETRPLCAWDAASREAIDEVDRQAFSGMEDDLSWAESEWLIAGRLEGELVSIVGLLERQVTVNGEPLQVAGVSGVATLPAYQKRGYASRLLREAEAVMRSWLRPEFGLLVCDAHNLHFYSSLGWQPVQGAVLIDQPDGRKHELPGHVLALPLRGHPWPEGPVDLCGLPW